MFQVIERGRTQSDHKIMKISERLKTKRAEETFSALVLVLLIILWMLGAVAMLVGSAIGLVAYVVLFRERLRARGWLKVIIPITAAALFGAAIAVALSRGH
jgi:hypothetical protein